MRVALSFIDDVGLALSGAGWGRPAFLPGAPPRTIALVVWRDWQRARRANKQGSALRNECLFCTVGRVEPNFAVSSARELRDAKITSIRRLMRGPVK